MIEQRNGMQELSIELLSNIGTLRLEGRLSIPEAPQGIIIFAHGSGSGRFSPRNQYVAEALNKDGLGTLLVDLLTTEEEKIDNRTRQYRFDIPLLSRRLIRCIDWAKENSDIKNLKLGLFGASTGSAAALIASSERPNVVSAFVSRGGRPDLVSSDSLAKVRTPTLLLIGENDTHLIDLSNRTLADLKNVEKKKLTVIPGASHLFEEPGKLEQVARIASGWFRCYFLIEEHGRRQN